MPIKRILIVVCSIFLYAQCTPVHQVIENSQQLVLDKIGFVTNDVFQVKCSVKLPLKVNRQKYQRRNRKNLLSNCRNITVSELAKFSIQYDTYAKNKWDKGTKADSAEENLLEVNWLTSDISLLKEHYIELFPGHIVYEKENEDNLEAIYRLTSKDLMNRVIQMSLPLILRNRYIKTINETNLKNF